MWDPIYLTNKRKFTCNTLQLNSSSICITIPLWEYCTATESCTILAVDNFLLRKSLPGLERRLTCLWLIKINSTLNSSVWAPHRKYFFPHFCSLRRLPDITNTCTIDSGQKIKEMICNKLVYLNMNHFPGKSQYSSTAATESSTTVHWSHACVICVIIMDSHLLIQLKTNRNRFWISILYFGQW